MHMHAAHSAAPATAQETCYPALCELYSELRTLG